MEIHISFEFYSKNTPLIFEKSNTVREQTAKNRTKSEVRDLFGSLFADSPKTAWFFADCSRTVRGLADVRSAQLYPHIVEHHFLIFEVLWFVCDLCQLLLIIYIYIQYFKFI